MNADGSGVIATRVCGWEAFCHHARWSPDGTRILFTRGLTGDNTIWTIHRDGGGQVQVVANGHSDNAEWSRDGALIAYEHEDSDAGLFYPDIWVAPADGSSHARVTFDMNGVEPSWGP
jgi:Tol biopolymer transport system component